VASAVAAAATVAAAEPEARAEAIPFDKPKSHLPSASKIIHCLLVKYPGLPALFLLLSFHDNRYDKRQQYPNKIPRP